MPPDSWQRAKDVLGLALARPPADRHRVVDSACGDDGALQREVRDLLDCHEAMGSFLEAPLLRVPEEGTADCLPEEIETWPRYQRIERIGSGGMAVVYKAWDPRLQRPVAIKLLGQRDERTVRRFLREAEAQARVDHDYVLKVYETGVVGSHHYIAMQYVEGQTLLGVRDATTLDEKVALMLKLAEGLDAAHRHGLIHRDVKPGNILVDARAGGLKPYLLDFGLAMDLGAPALTQTGVVMGTPRYMAPERVTAGAAAVDHRADIYGLGASFYELISGRTPFAGSSGLQVLVDVVHAEPPPLRQVAPGTPPQLDAIVAKCLEKAPERRYPSARALAEDLRRYLDGEAILARPAGTTERIARRIRKHPRMAAAFAAMLVATLALGGWGTYSYARASQQAALAQTFGEEVRDLEWIFRAAQMSPLHPIETGRRRVRERMARVTELMERLPAIAYGPGHYALGRGALTLGDAPTALEHLERAWAEGYRTPDVATALGLAHGEIFRVQLARAQRIAGDRERTARIAELETAHRDRALAFLEQGRASAIVPARYVEALIAAHRDDLANAIAYAGDAARDTSWLFEARLLPGHLQFKEAVRLYVEGDFRGAATLAAEAERHYAGAQRIAPSALDAHIGRCAVAGLVLHMSMHGLPADEEPLYRRADESCSNALVVDPDSAEAHRLLGEAVRFYADRRVQNGGDPGDAYDRSAALTRRALDLSGEDIEALAALADTYLDRAWWDHRSGRDPRPAMNQAFATYEALLARDPRHSAVHNRGLGLLLLGRWETAQGLNPLGSFSAAVASFEQSLRVDPTQAFSFRSLARAAVERAAEESRRRIDPVPGLERTLRFIEQLPGDTALPERVASVAQIRGALPE